MLGGNIDAASVLSSGGRALTPVQQCGFIDNPLSTSRQLTHTPPASCRSDPLPASGIQGPSHSQHRGSTFGRIAEWPPILRRIEALQAGLYRDITSGQHRELVATGHRKWEFHGGFAKWMRMQSAEEHTHAMKVFDFLRERNVTITLSTIEAPRTKYGPEPLEVFGVALTQEQEVTRQINHLYELALKEKDYSTLPFLAWFLQEQVEEENTVSDIIDRLRLAGENAAALLRLDAEAAGRVAGVLPENPSA